MLTPSVMNIYKHDILLVIEKSVTKRVDLHIYGFITYCNRILAFWADSPHYFLFKNLLLYTLKIMYYFYLNLRVENVAKRKKKP